MVCVKTRNKYSYKNYKMFKSQIFCGWVDISFQGDMKVMQFKTQTGQKVLDLQGHNGDVAALSLNPTDSDTFITGSVDRTARMWDLRSPGCVQTFWGHKADVNSVSVHPSGVSFLSCSEDKTVTGLVVNNN